MRHEMKKNRKQGLAIAIIMLITCVVLFYISEHEVVKYIGIFGVGFWLYGIADIIGDIKKDKKVVVKETPK